MHLRSNQIRSKELLNFNASLSWNFLDKSEDYHTNKEKQTLWGDGGGD